MRHWTVETQWIRFEQASKIIATACVLIGCLWSLAVARWSQAGTDQVRLANFDPDKINPRMLLSSDDPPGQNMSWNRSHDVFLMYEPDIEKLKSLALSLPVARALPAGSRRKLVFAPTKYLDPEFLHRYRIDFQQLPFQIYEAIERLER